MRFKRFGSWFFILLLFCGMIMIFSPNSVKGFITTYSENFDSTGVGNQVDASWLNTEESTDYSTDFHVVDDQPGAGKQFQIGDRVAGAIGWFNYTYDIDKMITNCSFNYYGEAIGASAHNLFMYFNNSAGDTIIKIQFNYDNAPGTLKFYYYSHSLGQTEIITEVADSSWIQVSLEIVDATSIRYSAANASLLSNGNVDTDYTALTNRIVSTYNFHGTVGGAGDGTMLMDNLSILVDYNTTGNTTINVYNESNPSVAIPDWSLLIYDDNNVIYYNEHNLDNPITINHSVYGTGDTFFQINATNYYSRTYYADIRNGVHYILDAFLAYTDDANIYSLIVVDDSDLDAILYIDDAEVTITRIINGSVHEVASGVTDGSGRFYVSLIPDVTYNVNISATGYTTLHDTYVPSSTVFEHTFRMTATTPTSVSYDYFFENVSIDIDMVSAGCLQDGNITITYLDSNSSTTNTEMQLWEIYGTTNTLLNTWTNTSSSFFNIQSGINTTRIHYLVVYFNNTADFILSQPIIISIPNVDSPLCAGVTPFDLDDRIDDIFGDFTIDDTEVPWTVVLGSIIPIMLLVSFGPYNTGLGVISCGISMSMLQGFLSLYVSGGFQWGIVGIGAFITIIGVLYIMTKGTGGDHL